MKVVDDPNVSGRNEEMNSLLAALSGLLKGDASVRLPLHWSGVSGKVADAFNDVVEQNADMADELARLRQVVGKEGKLKQRASLREARGFWGESIDCINSLIDDLVHPTSEVARVIGAVAQGDLSQEHGARGRRPAARGRVPAHRQDHQQDGRPARQLLGRGDARGARGRHRRQARRPGQGQGRRRHLEGPDRLGQLDGRQPDRPGAQHRRRDDRRRQGRPVEEDRRRRQGRVPDAEEHHQHDGRPAALVRVGSDAGGARGRHRRLARRPGARRGRLGHVEGPDRLGQLDGRQPDVAGAQHRRRDQGRGGRRPVEEDHRRRQGRDPRAEEHRQHDGRPAALVRRRSDARGARGRHRRQARRPGRRAGRGRHLEGPDRVGQLHGRQPDLARCATSPR